MTTGHVLPGYGNPVTRLRRAHTAYPMDRNKLKEFAIKSVPPLEKSTLDQIRANARHAWSLPDREKTTYGYFHRGSELDEPTQCRPTSPTRRHKPHPKPRRSSKPKSPVVESSKQSCISSLTVESSDLSGNISLRVCVFLTNRLHYINGYHNADATMGKDVYRVDNSLPSEERQMRLQAREKYIARPMTAAVNQYQDPYASLKEDVGPVEAWGAQAWMNIADDEKQHEVMNAVRDYREKDLFRGTTPVQQTVDDSPRPVTAIPSMHRWLKHAGAQELTNLQGSYQVYPPGSIQPLGNKMGTTHIRRQQELDAVKKSRYTHKPIRGDFLIHPEWPPTFPHHRLGN